MNKKAKTFNEFVNESLWDRIKGMAGGRRRDHQEETHMEEEDSEESSDREYREIVDRLMQSFDEPRAIDHYFNKLREIGRLAEFKSSPDWQRFSDMYNAFRR
jgi:hypothetical protein